MVRASATADSDMPFSSLGSCQNLTTLERAEVLTTYLGRRLDLQRYIEHAPADIDGRETSTRRALEDAPEADRLPERVSEAPSDGQPACGANGQPRPGLTH